MNLPSDAQRAELLGNGRRQAVAKGTGDELDLPPW